MRISVTELDAYRRYRDQEDVELEQLLLQLRKLEPPSQAMLAGKAFHYVLEHAKPGEELTTAKVDDFTFRFQLDCALELPRVRELKGEIVVMTSVGPVTLVGVVDGLDGPVIDYKLTSRFDAERYADSYQWRCYLVMFNAEEFSYRVFVQREDTHTGDIVVYEYHPFSFYAYPGMREHVLREVEQFAVFLAKHLPERVQVKEAA
jgi:hypothetical protein